jgi:dienelactone hydrolase
MPDLFKGDPVPLNPPQGFDMLNGWFPNHIPEITRPIVDKVVAAIKELKPKTVVANGYCFGAKYAVQLLGEGHVDNAAIYHPSFVSIDEIRAIKGPLLICGAETDTIYTEELRHETEATLKEIGATYYTTLASGVSHGFAVRGDPSKPADKWAKEQAFQNTVQWFAYHRKSPASKI